MTDITHTIFLDNDKRVVLCITNAERGISADALPEKGIGVTAEAADQIIKTPDCHYVDGEIVGTKLSDMEYFSRDLEAVYKRKMLDARVIADRVGEQYLSRYSDIERGTFATQKEELELYQADPDAATPLLDEFASRRGIARDVIMTKVQEAVNNLKAVSGLIVGEQQALEDRIKSAYEIKNTYTDQTSQLVALKDAIAALTLIDVSISV